MAGIHAVNSFSDSLSQFLSNTYPAVLRDLYPCDFRVVSSNELDSEEDFGTAVTFYLYRVIVNEYLRNTPQVSNNQDGNNPTVPPLSLDLHIMISIWADSAAAEQTIGTWVMRQLYQHPLMDASALTPEGEWQSGEIIHVIPAELSNEDLMRIWDAISRSYRLSMSYIARSVRIDPVDVGGDLPIVSTRFGYEDTEAVSDA